MREYGPKIVDAAVGVFCLFIGTNVRPQMRLPFQVGYDIWLTLKSTERSSRTGNLRS